MPSRLSQRSYQLWAYDVQGKHESNLLTQPVFISFHFISFYCLGWYFLFPFERTARERLLTSAMFQSDVQLAISFRVAVKWVKFTVTVIRYWVTITHPMNTVVYSLLQVHQSARFSELYGVNHSMRSINCHVFFPIRIWMWTFLSTS